MEITDASVAWFAGLMEGEGCFFLIRNIVKGKVYLYPHFSINMTDLDVMQKVSDLTGQKIFKGKPPKNGPSKKPYYRVVCSGRKAVEWMRKIYPLMGERRQAKINELLEYWDNRDDANTLRSRALKEYRAQQRLEDTPHP